MKWIGQSITDFIARFRSDVYLDSPTAGGSDPDKFLGIDSDNKIIYRTGTEVLSDIGASSTTGDIEGVTAGTGMSGGGTSGTVTLTNAGVTSNVAGNLIDVSGATGAVTVNVDLSELSTITEEESLGFFAIVDGEGGQGKIAPGNVATLAGLTSFGSAGATTNILAGDIDWYNPVTTGDPSLRMGVDVNECLHIVSKYQSGTQSMQQAVFQTHTASGTANDGEFVFMPDGVAVLDIDDGGLDLRANMGVSIAGTDILTDSSGTATLSNIDALDATTKTTIARTADAATATNTGVVELATTAEADSGTDTARAVTPAGLKSHVDATKVIGQLAILRAIQFYVNDAPMVQNSLYFGNALGHQSNNWGDPAAVGGVIGDTSSFAIPGDDENWGMVLPFNVSKVEVQCSLRPQLGTGDDLTVAIYTGVRSTDSSADLTLTKIAHNSVNISGTINRYTQNDVSATADLAKGSMIYVGLGTEDSTDMKNGRGYMTVTITRR